MVWKGRRTTVTGRCRDGQLTVYGEALMAEGGMLALLNRSYGAGVTDTPGVLCSPRFSSGQQLPKAHACRDGRTYVEHRIHTPTYGGVGQPPHRSCDNRIIAYGRQLLELRGAPRGGTPIGYTGEGVSIVPSVGRVGRAVECAGLENQFRGNSNVGSNPTPSAIIRGSNFPSRTW